MKEPAVWWLRPPIIVAIVMVVVALVLFWLHLASHVATQAQPVAATFDASGMEDPQDGLLIMPEPDAPAVSPTLAATATPGHVVVYISGAVVRPDVYTLPHDARVKDVVMAAGGFTIDANSERINLAAYIRDAEHIHVPYSGEDLAATTSSEVTTENQPEPVADALININSASAVELEELPGIGPALSQRIVDYRTANGPFASVEDLKSVKGIGPAAFEHIRDLVTVGT